MRMNKEKYLCQNIANVNIASNYELMIHAMYACKPQQILACTRSIMKHTILSSIITYDNDRSIKGSIQQSPP